jgi:phosphatidylglycerol---prolipoprotein diacylglyceryl transferase
VQDIAFQIGNFPVYWYGIFVAAGFLAAFWTASKRAPLAGISSEVMAGLVPWIIVGAIIGARLLYVITYWQQDFAGKPFIEVFRIRSGLVFYGGLIGASVATILYTRKHKLSLWKTADVAAPSIALGHVFGRLGCFMSGCCYGRSCDLPWAVRFPEDHWTAGAPVHPTQLYESGLNLLLFFGLAWLFRRRRFDGQVFATYLVAYAVLRAFVESFRGDYPSYLLGVLTPAQIVSVGILAAGLFLFWLLPRPAEPKQA